MAEWGMAPIIPVVGLIGCQKGQGRTCRQFVSFLPEARGGARPQPRRASRLTAALALRTGERTF